MQSFFIHPSNLKYLVLAESYWYIFNKKIDFQEFEQLIDQHGAEEVTSLMQKVISALEHLEQLVHHNETEMQTIEDLRKTIEHLEHEETKKADERVKYARDIEQVEEHYKV